uniref:NADH dehydrogenase subunit 6 n=1 Tax=Sogata hakonensis TaxID=871477 RepID=A0A7S4Z1G0_9HEMI|nr:NADH dehydrogenase subunit 6 [Sogata hakonensis]
MKLTMFTLMMNSLISMCMNHPISLGSILMIQSILTSVMTIFLTKNSWYAMILFITFSSGLMIMFMYMSSISSNEKFFPSIKITLTLMFFVTILLILNKDKMLLYKTKWMEKNFWMEENEEKKSIFKMLKMNKLNLLIFMTTFILLTLITISNMINSFEGPLKKTYVSI